MPWKPERRSGVDAKVSPISFSRNVLQWSANKDSGGFDYDCNGCQIIDTEGDKFIMQCYCNLKRTTINLSQLTCTYVPCCTIATVADHLSQTWVSAMKMVFYGVATSLQAGSVNGSPAFPGDAISEHRAYVLMTPMVMTNENNNIHRFSANACSSIRISSYACLDCKTRTLSHE